jgi:PKHD-type hydroxylase
MNLENYYYVFEGAVPSRLCDDLVAYGEQQATQVALTGDFDGKVPENQKDISKLYKTRNSSIVWMNEPWIYNSITPLVKEANIQAGWNFEWNASESCQWTKYAETQHYTWHQDSWNKAYNRPGAADHGLIRKLSVTVSLADGNSYEGGDLEFDLRNNGDSSPNVITSESARKKGSVIVFPSFVWHRVAPVTKGVRYSLVIWNLGRPFV